MERMQTSSSTLARLVSFAKNQNRVKRLMSKIETPSGMNKGGTDSVPPLEKKRFIKGVPIQNLLGREEIYNGVAIHDVRSKEEKMKKGVSILDTPSVRV